MPVTFTLRQPTAIPIEVDSIRLETVRTQSLDQIRATPVQYGNKQQALGTAGIRPGAGMRRGTIGLLGSEPAPPMLPTFKFACTYRPEFLLVDLHHLRRHGFAVPDECLSAACRRYNGDCLELGKGEILVRVPA